MLHPFGPDIWIVDGPEITGAGGFHFPTRMVIIRLSNGALFVWSPIKITDDLRTQIDALGPVQHIIAPNSLHHMSVPEWHQAYPEAQVHAAPGLHKRRRDIVFDGDLGDEPNAAWRDDIDQVVMDGNAITTEVVFFHRQSGTALFVDLLQQMPTDWYSGWRSVVAKLDLMVGPEPTVPRKFRIAFTNRTVARAAIARVFAWPVTQVVMAHGPPVTTDAAAFLRRAFRWLAP